MIRLMEKFFKKLKKKEEQIPIETVEENVVTSNTDTRDQKEKQLIDAMDPDDIESFKYLIEEQGIDVHAQKEALLIKAIWAHNYDAIKYLLDKGADPYADENQPLFDAIHASSETAFLMRLLAKWGVNIRGDNDCILNFIKQVSWFPRRKVENILKAIAANEPPKKPKCSGISEEFIRREVMKPENWLIGNEFADEYGDEYVDEYDDEDDY